MPELGRRRRIDLGAWETRPDKEMGCFAWQNGGSTGKIDSSRVRGDEQSTTKHSSQHPML